MHQLHMVNIDPQVPGVFTVGENPTGDVLIIAQTEG